MILSKNNLKSIQASNVALPDEKLFLLPEKVLQFGTGVLLRALPDYFIDKANRLGIFNGRVVVVKSTSTDASAFDKQDGLYTLVIKGIEEGKLIEENIVSSAISRVLSASSQWAEILQCAHNPEMNIIISNTTEVGLQLHLEEIGQTPPKSFPGKLLAFLLERFNACNGRPDGGMVIIPTELIPDNGKKLRAILLELAKHNTLSSEFIQWLSDHNSFCSSLVDRIVPGKPEEPVLTSYLNSFGYEDELLTASEVYRLWAIEGDEKVKSILSFAKADEGVIISPDIEIHRELKLRLLNATHTLSSGVAFLGGFETVLEAMNNPVMNRFITQLMKEEVASAIPYPISSNVIEDFSNRVLDRFSNPHIKHFWINITVQYSTKIRTRALPVLLKHYQQSSTAPELIATGIAAWITFMKSVEAQSENHYGQRGDVKYSIKDDQATYVDKQWQKHGVANIVKALLSDHELWGTDLSTLPGFENAVQEKFNSILTVGILKTIEQTIRHEK